MGFPSHSTMDSGEVVNERAKNLKKVRFYVKQAKHNGFWENILQAVQTNGCVLATDEEEAEHDKLLRDLEAKCSRFFDEQGDMKIEIDLETGEAKVCLPRVKKKKGKK